MRGIYLPQKHFHDVQKEQSSCKKKRRLEKEDHERGFEQLKEGGLKHPKKCKGKS